MNAFINKIQFHLRRIAFEKYGIPKVINEKISKSILKKYLPAHPVIIDCGAHDGSDSIALAKLFKKGIIHSFEPVENLFVRLKKNTQPYPNIKCYKIALSDQNGVQNFFISEGASDASSSLLEPLAHLKDHPDTFFKTNINVPTATLDYWMNENNVQKIDMLWLDMQGFELKMLQASKSVLNTVKVIHTEVSTRETYKSVAQYFEYKFFLEQLGFKVVIEAIPKNWDMGNLLFVKNKNLIS